MPTAGDSLVSNKCVWQVKIADFGLAVLDTAEDPAHFETVKVRLLMRVCL